MSDSALLARSAAEDLREIDAAASRIKVQGARYPEDLMKLSGR